MDKTFRLLTMDTDDAIGRPRVLSRLLLFVSVSFGQLLSWESQVVGIGSVSSCGVWWGVFFSGVSQGGCFRVVMFLCSAVVGMNCQVFVCLV